MTSLLDVNVLVSLLDANHEHHYATKGWFDQNDGGWASCPTTQNGYLRIVTGAKYGNRIDIKEALEKLSKAVSTRGHKFLSDDISLLNQQHFEPKHFQGHNQLTDIYLLALSVHHGARFVTLDQRISRLAVPQSTAASVHFIRP